MARVLAQKRRSNQTLWKSRIRGIRSTRLLCFSVVAEARPGRTWPIGMPNTRTPCCAGVPHLARLWPVGPRVPQLLASPGNLVENDRDSTPEFSASALVCGHTDPVPLADPRALASTRRTCHQGKRRSVRGAAESLEGKAKLHVAPKCT